MIVKSFISAPFISVLMKGSATDSVSSINVPLTVTVFVVSFCQMNTPWYLRGSPLEGFDSTGATIVMFSSVISVGY